MKNIGWTISETIGISIVNAGAVSRIDLFNKNLCMVIIGNLPEYAQKAAIFYANINRTFREEIDITTKMIDLYQLLEQCPNDEQLKEECMPFIFGAKEEDK